MIDRIAHAVRIASEVHEGQVDKGGHPYILHPLAVLADVAEDTPGDNPYEWTALLCAAVLHDAVEDCAPGERDRLETRIYNACGSRCSSAVDALTRRPGDQYMRDYISRIERDWIARRVKMADLRHNLDESRLPKDAGPRTRADRYRRALERLNAVEMSAR